MNLIEQLSLPNRRVDVVLDTDTYNEIDDQFALAYLLLSEDKLHTLGITAAPFKNAKSTSPEDGMEKSYLEILKCLMLLGREDMKEKVYKGSRTYLPDENTPVASDAASYIALEAKKHSPEDPLYVVAIGAITNVASAVLLDRESMVNNTVLVWLGGHALHYPHNREFNLFQDVAAARVVFGCGMPLVQLPCMGVVSEFRTTEPELRHWLAEKNPLADYLYRNTVEEAEKYAPHGSAWSRCIWDVAAVAWLLNENDRFMKSYLVPSPIPQYDHHYSTRGDRHPIRYVYEIHRDALFTDLFTKLTKKP